MLKRLSLAALVVIIGSSLLWIIFSPKEDISRRIYKTLEEQQKNADLSFKQVTFQEVQGAEKFWELKAESAAVNKSTGLATLQTSNGLFFKDGRPTLKFISPAALWDMRKKEIYLDKPIGYDLRSEKKIEQLIKKAKNGTASVFTFPKTYQDGLGYWFQARDLRWKLADQLLVCTGGIQLNKGEILGTAETLKGDVGFKKVTLSGSPRLLLASTQGAPMTLEANAFEIESARDLFVAQGDPVITWKTSRVVSQLASYFQNQKKIDLSGNVRINYKDIAARGDAAEYFVDAQKVILSGNAFAEQGDRQLKSDKVIVSLKDQKISLAGKSQVVIPGKEIE